MDKRAIEESFPVVEINRLAVPERNAFKPIYQMHKWFARRASCVFRAILLSAMKPAGTNIMEEFYKDHTNDPLTNGKVILDPFMGGGTTVVEALRLGCRVIGMDLNPVAWFIVKTEVELVDLEELKEAFERLAERRIDWSGRSVKETLLDQYKTACPCCGNESADIIYTFWVKSAVCTISGCKKEVPLFSDYLIAYKTPSIRYHKDCACPKCGRSFDWEIEPSTLVAEPSLMVDNSQDSAGIGRGNKRWVYGPEKEPLQCPWCSTVINPTLSHRKQEKKKVPLSVLYCPHCASVWQYRGTVPEEVACPVCKKGYRPQEGNVPEKGKFLCPCGTKDNIINSIRKLLEDQLLPMRPYAIEGYCSVCGDNEPEEVEENLEMFEHNPPTPPLEKGGKGGFAHPCILSKNNGKFFKRVTPADLALYQQACEQWEKEKERLPYPKQEIPDGQETHRLLEHHYRHWHQMFNPRQLLCLSTLLKAIDEEPDQVMKEMLLSAFYQVLRNQNMFCFHNPARHELEPLFSRHDFAPLNTALENSVWGGGYGRGTFESVVEKVIRGKTFCQEPYDTGQDPIKHGDSRDPLQGEFILFAQSSTVIGEKDYSVDFVVTDPPYADNVNYSELADFFYVWLRLSLADVYSPFSPDFTPKAEEIIENPARGKTASDFKEGLARVFRECHRVLKDNGLMVFTFHHVEGDAWESVLSALCESGFEIDSVWERRAVVIASIDAIKRPPRMERLLSGPRWDMIVFDEAHHLTRRRYGKKIDYTQNYRLAEALRGHTRDLLFLSATPHQGDVFQFWSIIQLLDDQLFESPEAMQDHRGLLNRVMIRRIKREVTDALGQPIFMRRQVHGQAFPLAAKERAFYDFLTEYLREGYGVAGLGQSRTTSEQRAVGFVMATFQKIMSSSPRAIKQALRRRLLVLLARQQMSIEGRQSRHQVREEMAARIVSLQEEMRELAIAILGIPPSPTQRAEADAYIAQLKQRLARKIAAGEVTEWTLDSEEDIESSIYAETNIPDEPRKVRELLQMVPEGPDRKFDTLIRAIEQIRREYPQEKFVIFTQYRETQEFLREHIARLYSEHKIAILRGGPLEDKIAAVEAFWDPNGAQFLISTSAGGEGINLQVGHILFNYDMPWNPMAVEQRIGRLHRYGQQDTVQVYNLVAEDTVEAHIYRLLEEKLLEIARTIGKVDTVTGEVMEDFRSEILGLLGSTPNYQELYKRALVDRDYRRTEGEIAESVEKARLASEALRTLSQDLDSFNLEHYRSLQGQFSLRDLQDFFEKAIIRLGGTMIPDGETYRIKTPDILMSYPKVIPYYDAITFNRQVAMRRRKVEFLGLGHPLIDALIAYLQSSQWPSEVAFLRVSAGQSDGYSVRYLITAQFENGHTRRLYRNCLLGNDGSWSIADERFDLALMTPLWSNIVASPPGISPDWGKIRLQAEAGLTEFEIELRAKLEGLLSLRGQIIGISVLFS